MIALSLQSGSNGNCLYVEAGGRSLLFDAGIAGREARRRMAAAGRDIHDVDALIISHDHTDHVGRAGVFQRMFGMPVYMTRPTADAARRRLGRMDDVRHFRAGKTLALGGVRVRTIPTPHDGVDCVAFIVEAEGKRLGILTDLGHVFPALGRALRHLDAVFIESNYDRDMLLDGPYPEMLKDRIIGPGGHISNLESACLLRDRAGDRLRWACLAHLSDSNNAPAVAIETHRSVLGGRFPLHVAGRHGPSGILEV